MQETKSLLQLQNRGSVLFIFSDKFKVYVIYHDMEGDLLYKFVCSKQLTIESAHALDVPEKFFEYAEIQWHFPTHSLQNDLVFTGAVTIRDETFLFSINEKDQLIMNEKSSSPNVFALLPMSSLENIEVEAYIQKSNHLYAIGYHRETHKQLFLLVDISQDKLMREYTLSSSVGEIIANTLNIDRSEGRIYIGGRVRDPKTLETIRPFFESFLMPTE